MSTNSEQLEAAFLAAFSFDAEEGQTAFEKFLDDNATVIDDDQTNILDKAGWLDHFAFHSAKLWESVEIVHYDIESQIIGGPESSPQITQSGESLSMMASD